MVYCLHNELEFRNVDFRGRGKPEKTRRSPQLNAHMASQPEYELGVNWFLRREENRRRSSEKPWDLNQQQTVCSPIHDKLHIKRSNIKLNRQHLYKYYTTLQLTNLKGVKRERSAKNVFHKGDSLYSQKPSPPSNQGPVPNRVAR